MSTSAPAENPLPETSTVELGGLQAGDTVMDWLRPEAASHSMLTEQARTYLARERIFVRDIQTLLRGLAPLSRSLGRGRECSLYQTLHGVKRILGTLPEVVFCPFRACGQRGRDLGPGTAAHRRSLNAVLRFSAPTSRGDIFWPTASAFRAVGSQR